MAVVFTRNDQQDTAETTLFYDNERDTDTLTIKEDGVRSIDQPRALFPWETRSLRRRRILQVIIGVLGVAIIVSIILAFKLINTESKYSYLGTARFKPKEWTIDFKNAANEFVLTAHIGMNLRNTALQERHTKTKSKVKYVNSNGIILTLTQETKNIFSVNWTTISKHPIKFIDCFELSNAHWYGGGELSNQPWPLENVEVHMAPYVPSSVTTSHSLGTSMQSFGNLLERYWLCSKGVAIFVDSSVPLHVSLNETGNGKLCIKSDKKDYPPKAVSYLGYRVLSGHDARELQYMAVKEFLGKAHTFPNKDLITKASWIVKHNVSDRKIKEIRENMLQFKYNCSYVLIKRQKHNALPLPYSSIHKDEFINLKRIGCKIGTDVYPYIKVSTTEFLELANKDYFIKDCKRKVPGLIMWKNSLAAVLDLTLVSGKNWLKNKLANLGYDLFQFHGVDALNLPLCCQFTNGSINPGHFLNEYAKFAANMNGSIVSVGYRSQALPIFIQINRKENTWDGLRSLIPTILTYGIMGYPYIMPPPVGGNHGNTDEELYVRWMQLNVFLPAMQFRAEMAPWTFELKEIFAHLFKLRNHLIPVLLEAFSNVTRSGAPIIRPLWWVAPKDPRALEHSSQFMLGDTYLVAPVLVHGATKKMVYLPVGHWKEEFDERNVIDVKKTGLWKEYPVSLKTVLYFKCLALYS